MERKISIEFETGNEMFLQDLDIKDTLYKAFYNFVYLDIEVIHDLNGNIIGYIREVI